jgi:hypothetical protein
MGWGDGGGYGSGFGSSGFGSFNNGVPTSGPNPFGLGGTSMQPQNMTQRPASWNFFGQPNVSLAALGGRY